jgi:hypothetical protein
MCPGYNDASSVCLFMINGQEWRRTYQNVVPSTTILTVPGKREFSRNVSSTSMTPSPSWSVLSSSSPSRPSTSSGASSSSVHGGLPAPDERKIPAAAACVSIGEDRAAEFPAREFRAMRTCGGFMAMLIAECGRGGETREARKASLFRTLL